MITSNESHAHVKTGGWWGKIINLDQEKSHKFIFQRQIIGEASWEDFSKKFHKHGCQLQNYACLAYME
jgi:hypothetical protein